MKKKYIKCDNEERDGEKNKKNKDKDISMNNYLIKICKIKCLISIEKGHYGHFIMR